MVNSSYIEESIKETNSPELGNYRSCSSAGINESANPLTKKLP